MTRIRESLIVVMVALTFAGCTFSRLQIGAPLVAGADASLYTGQWKVEVLERLGPPDRVTMTWGEPIFEYLYRKKLGRELELSFFRARFDYEQNWQKSDRLVIRFNRDGRVRDYGINLETSEKN